MEKAPHEKLHSLHRSHNIVRVIKSIRLRWADHVVRMEEGRSAFTIKISKLCWIGDIMRMPEETQ